MKRFWQFLTLLMLALMVPASFCCYAADECSGDACCSDHQELEDHEDGEPHVPVSCPSDTIAHSRVPGPITLPPMQIVEMAEMIQALSCLQDELTTTTDSSWLPMTTAPPGMRAMWHFIHRTALPVRAPSIKG